MESEQRNSENTSAPYSSFLSRWGLAVVIAGFTIGVIGMYLVVTGQRTSERSFELYEFEYRTSYSRLAEEFADLEERVLYLERHMHELQREIVVLQARGLGQPKSNAPEENTK